MLMPASWHPRRSPLGEINAMAGERLPDLLRRFGCRLCATRTGSTALGVQAALGDIYRRYGEEF